MRHLLTLFAFVISETLLPANLAAEEQLRSTLNDGSNAVALLGEILGIEILPGRSNASSSTYSLREIQLQLEAHGVTTSVRELSFHELASCNLPCIVPMRFGTANDASFCVFVHTVGSEVYVVEAGPLLVRAMSVDDFRRYWTGHAVYGEIASRTRGNSLIGIPIGVGLPFICFGGYAWARRRFLTRGA